VDKQFWLALTNNDYQVPDGHTLNELTRELFGYLGSTDPELRDDIAYIVYANFLKREKYSKDDIRAHVKELLANLDKGIGETETDSVFLRTFSVLLLSEIVHNDNKKPLLDRKQVHSILAGGLRYLSLEKDPRGYVPVKGWAHALAHTADLMLVLGTNRFTDRSDHKNILKAIADKLVRSTNWVYIHGEDERLAKAVIAILERNMIVLDFLQEWLTSFIKPEKSWRGSYTDEGQARAFHNVRNFLRSLLFAVRKTDNLFNKEKIQSSVLETLDKLKAY
jgi:hypothetical protein